MSNLYSRLRALVQRVETGQSSLGMLSTGERLAVSLVLDQIDDLRLESHTALSAVDRIGTEWTQAAIAVQRDGWHSTRSTDQEASHG